MLPPPRREGVGAKEMTLRYIASLEDRVKRLERREWIWICAALASIGVNVYQFVVT